MVIEDCVCRFVCFMLCRVCNGGSTSTNTVVILTGGVQAGIVLWEALPGQAAHEWGQASEQGGGEQAEGEGRRRQRPVERPALPPSRTGPHP